MKTVAILTATYNRADTLPKLYESLRAQTSFDFAWYIIDDGSRDHTDSVVRRFATDLFDIHYIQKENGGRHTALNLGFQIAQEELFFPVDSDDWLTPDAVETIILNWPAYRNQTSIAGMSFYRLYGNGDVISAPYPSNYLVGSFIDVRINGGIKGDNAEVYRSAVLKKYNFPEIEGEKFLSEAILWNRIAQEYSLVFIQKGIYHCEYRADGLTQNGRQKQLRNPKGTIMHAKAYMYKNVRFSIRLKYGIMYVASAKIAGMSSTEAFRDSGAGAVYALCYLPGTLLYLLWKKKYNL